MINLRYSLVIESTEDSGFFGFYSPDLEGFSGIGTSVEDCLSKAERAIDEHVRLLKEAGLPVPVSNLNSTVSIRKSERVIPAA